MPDLMNEAYLNCSVGETSWVRPAPERKITLMDFQAVEVSAKAMQQDGKIHIEELHRESQTGNRLIDGIKFVRIL